MQCLIVTLFVLGCLLLTFLLSASAHAGAQRRNRVYQQLAAHYRGKWARATWWGSPQVRFQHGESQVVVDTYPSRNAAEGRITRVQISWPEDTFFGELRSIGRSSAGPGIMPAERGAQVRTIGRYDYQVVTNDPAGMQALLTDGVRWQLDALRLCLRENQLNVRIAYGRLVIHKARWLVALHELKPFVQLCLDFYDQAMIARTAGVSFLGEDQAQVLEGKCPVCGGLIEHDLVFCRRCKTPHHGECWTYNSVCSTYGCGETNYRRPDGTEYSAVPPRPAPKPR